MKISLGIIYFISFSQCFAQAKGRIEVRQFQAVFSLLEQQLSPTNDLETLVTNSNPNRQISFQLIS